MRQIIIATAALFALSSSAVAGDAAAGKMKMVKCQACHGKDGQSKNPEAPHISGQPERYLVKALKRYRNGERVDPQMTMMAKPLSDEDIADLAAYYASIKVTVEKQQ